MRIFKTTLLILISACFFSLSVSGQEGRTKRVDAYGVQMTFKNTQTRIKGIGLARNVLQIVNHTKKTMDFTLEVSIPAGWEQYGNIKKEISVDSKDTIYVPVRIKPHYSTKGDANYVVNAFLSNKDFTLTNAMWYISIQKKSDWHAVSLNNKVYFIGESDSVRFQLQLSNNGNSDEMLEVQCKRDKGLYFVNEFGNPIIKDRLSIVLKPMQDTVITYWVKRHREDIKPETSGKHITSKHAKKYYIKVVVVPERIDRGGSKRWTGSVEFHKLPDFKKVNESSFSSMPLTFELNTYDLLSNSSFSSLNLYGNHYFKDRSQLTYYYQADFIQNQLNSRSFLGNYHFLAYRNRLFGVELGDISSGLSGSTLSGKGVKGEVTLKRHTFGGMFIQKPYLFDKFFSRGYGGYYKYNHKLLNFDLFYQHEQNDLRKLVSDMGLVNLGLRLIRKHQFTFGAGYSNEVLNWDPALPMNLKGYGGRFSYNGNVRKFGIHINAFYGTKNYTPLRGAQSVSTSLRYQVNSENTLTLQGSVYNYNPELWHSGNVNDSLFNSRKKLDLRYVHLKKKYSVVFQPSLFTFESNLLKSRTSGAFIEYRTKSSTSLKFFATVFGGYTYFPEYPNVENIFISYMRSAVRYKGFQASVRYYYGPYYTLDQVQYIYTQENPQKWFSSIYYDFWFFKNSVRLNTNLNYNYNTINDRHQLNTRPEVIYYAKNGFQFSAYARYILYAEGESSRITYNQGGLTPVEEIIEANSSQSFEFGMGVKFNVNVPTGVARYYPVKVVAFKDLNGNGVKDINEVGIQSMLISLKKVDGAVSDDRLSENTPIEEIHDLVTNSDGMVEYRNVELGEYEITAMPLSSMGGWFDGKTFKRTIDKKKTVYIPLSKGARLSGGIIVERGRYSRDKQLILANIRVTAINQDNGRTHMTLTDKDGQFVLFVPNGNYTVEINENALPSRFQFMENYIPLSVNEEFDNYNISFYLAEKERTARISGRKNLPIKRQGDSKTGRRPVAEHDQRTQLDDPSYLPVVEPTEKGTYWVVQLHSDNQPRHKLVKYDTLKDLTPVRCLVGEGAGFVYVTKSFKKKRAAKKLLKKVIPRGYPDAQVVEMTFGSVVNQEAKVEPKTSDTPNDSIVNVVRPYIEPNKQDTAKATQVKTEEPKQDPAKTKEVDTETTGDYAIKQIESDEERNYYRVEIKASEKALTSDQFVNMIPTSEVVYEIQQDGLYKYSVGRFATYAEAKSYQQELQKKYQLTDSFVTQYKKSW